MKTWNTNLLQKRNNNGQMGPATLSPMKIWNTNLLQTRNNNVQMGLATLSHMKIWNTNLLQTWNNNGQMGFATYLSQGNGQFNLVTNIYNNAGSGYMTLFPMDINGDGRQDVLQTWNNNGQMAFTSYLSHGNGQFDLVTNTYNAGSGYLTLFPMDINGDCKQDVLQTWNNNGHMAFTSYMSDSDGNFHLISSDYPNAGTGYMTLFPIDINGDDKRDVLQTWDNNGQMGFASYLSQGNGQFNLVTNIYNVGSGYMTLFPMDINGDGRQDVLQTWNNNDHMAFTSYLSQGNGQFNLVTSTYTAGSGYMTLFPMDINGDGRQDVLQTWNNNGQMGLASYLSQGNGQFNLVTNTYNQGYGYMTLSPMDINVDGKSDMLQTWNNAGKMAFVSYLSRGDGYFDTINTYYNNAGAGYMTIWPLTNDFPKTGDITNYNKDYNGFRILNTGEPISGAGDINGDGIKDVIVGSAGVNSNNGAAYVIFGSTSFPSSVNALTLTGSNGFAINGSGGGTLGKAVKNAGDVNGDGIDDIIVGAPAINNLAGAAYVVYGSHNAFPASLSASSLNGNNGFFIYPPTSTSTDYRANWYEVGSSVTGGDVNGDGISDLIIGADLADYITGAVYVIFGSHNSFPSGFNLSRLNGANGFKISGTGSSNLGNTGDINGDGISDIIIGTKYATAYIVYGSNKAFPASLSTSALDGSNGFKIGNADNMGASVSIVKDINNDGIADMLIGQPGANYCASYVVFGSRTPFPATMNINALNGSNGFKISGGEADYPTYYSGIRTDLGASVSGAGDVNGDGISDIIVANKHTTSYIIYGSRGAFPANFNLSTINGANGFKVFHYDSDFSWSVSDAGDVNGDGIDDIMMNAPHPFGFNGISNCYVVFGE